MILSRTEKTRAYTIMLEDREPLTIKQLLSDLEYGDDLVQSILSRDKDGDSNGNGINDGDRAGTSASNSRDNKNDSSCQDT